MEARSNIKQLSLMGMFTAIIFILAFTPIGYIRLPFINATIVHIPVIIVSIVLGVKYGFMLGIIFGITSLINNSMAPTLSSFVFSPFIPVPNTGYGSMLALVVCFVPRILVGVVPYYVYNGLNKILKNKHDYICIVIAGVIGSLTNTLLVMNFIFLFFKDSYASIKNVGVDSVYNIILGIIAINGIPEAIAAGIITVSICIPLNNLVQKNK